MQKHCVSTLFGVFLLVSLPLSAATVVVDCSGATPGAFTTISSALATLNDSGPNTINVTGTCNEALQIQYRDRLIIEGSPSAEVHAPAGIVVNVVHSRGLILRRLTVTGGGRGVYVRAQSEATLDGVTITNGGNALVVDTQSSLSAGGPNAVNAVAITNNGFGVTLDGATFTAFGNVSIDNNNGTGIDAEASRVTFLGKQSATAPGGPNSVSGNASHGIFAHGGTTLDFRGQNALNGNALNAILGFENTNVDVIGNPGFTTTMDGNHRGGLALIFNASGRATNAVVTNNGSTTDPLSSGITCSNASSIIVSGTTISGTIGPGVIVTAGGMTRIASTSFSGNSAAPIQLLTGGILELQDGNSYAGADPVVDCDDSGILFGTGAAVPNTCKKTK